MDALSLQLNCNGPIEMKRKTQTERKKDAGVI